MDPNTMEMEHSLPVSAEELRTDNAMKGNPYSGHQKRRYALIAICVTACALIVGFTAAIIQNRISRRNNSSAATNKALSNWNESPTGPKEAEDESLSNARAATRLQPVIDFLSVRISEPHLFTDQQTPQYKAAKWIADQDFLNVAIPSDPQNYDQDYEFVQRYIMAVFYFALDGVNWRYKAYFMSSYEVCSWNMDFFQEVPGQPDATDDWLYGVQCDEKGAISTIFMTANGLKGQLPDSLGDLLDLDHLSLFANQITGSIPERLKFVTDLNFVNLQANLMSGRLPTWINKWRELEFLGLGDNQFTGPVPDLTGLDYLTELALDENILTGSIEVFNSLRFLESLFINGNNFNGTFGDNTWVDLDNLITIDISSNENIVGTVPEWVYYLESVDLHDNYLTGTLPVVKNPAGSPLMFFSVYGNDLDGPIPDSLGDCNGLTHLDLGDNYFTGSIPEEFGYLENLQVLYVTDNLLGPQPFPDLSDCVYLRELGIGDSKIRGKIPEWINNDNMPDLAVLDLRDNFLTGTIPDALSYLESLEILLLNYNDLVGEVPDFSFCPSLEILFVDNNGYKDTRTGVRHDLKGSLNYICDAGLEGLFNMYSDCTVECKCCAQCCTPDSVDKCNDWDETYRLSDKDERKQFLFSENQNFEVQSDTQE